jgi:sterol desaturase/sphingolipid hydroxylase (fatty acid hydroxylase superfamily)
VEFLTEYFPTVKVPVIAVLLAVLWWLEGTAPLFLDRRNRATRLGRHLLLAAFNAVLVVPFLTVAVWLAATPKVQEWGLLAWLDLPALAEILLALLLLDLWMYLWHRANHSIPLLWRFHRVHHSDPELDATSAFRFHTGEILLSALLRLALIPLLSIQLWHLILYELLMLPVIVFHHGNVRVPVRLDRVLRAVVVTPWMHWVHHSSCQPETDSNYATILSVWDRLFSTFRLVDDPRAIRFGLDEFREPKWQDLKGLLATPFISPEAASDKKERSDRNIEKPGPSAVLVHANQSDGASSPRR